MKGKLSDHTQQKLIGLLFELEYQARVHRGWESNPLRPLSAAATEGKAWAFGWSARHLRALLLESYSRMGLESFEELWNEQTNNGESPKDWDPEKAR